MCDLHVFRTHGFDYKDTILSLEVYLYLKINFPGNIPTRAVEFNTMKNYKITVAEIRKISRSVKGKEETEVYDCRVQDWLYRLSLGVFLAQHNAGQSSPTVMWILL